MTLLLRLLPYLLVIGGVLAAYTWAYQRGWDARDAEAKRERIAAVQRTIEQQEQLDAETLELEFDVAEQREVVRVVYRDRIKRVVEYAQGRPAVECLGADGVQLYNAIRAGVQGKRLDADAVSTGTATPVQGD
ncbi:MAG: hypothetical protein OQL08_09105 [Gammaproteobacteria bacterium]|nr:hypothetical protein [Gammaproteobacteria bacterium]